MNKECEHGSEKSTPNGYTRVLNHFWSRPTQVCLRQWTIFQQIYDNVLK
jgi:hypothetical protein